MTKEDILHHFQDINFYYNDCNMYDDLSRMLDELTAEIKGDPIECARTLKKHCINTKDCKECFMWDECRHELSAPCDWDLPDEERGEEKNDRRRNNKRD